MIADRIVLEFREHDLFARRADLASLRDAETRRHAVVADIARRATAQTNLKRIGLPLPAAVGWAMADVRPLDVGP